MKSYYKNNIKKIILYVFVSAIAAALMVGIAFIYQALTEAATSNDFSRLIKVALFAIPYLVIEASFDYVPRAARSVAVQGIMNDMRNGLVNHFMKQDIQKLENEKPSERSSKLVNDLQVIEQNYLIPLFSTFLSLFIFLLSLAAALTLQSSLTLIMLALSFIPFLSPIISKNILSDKKKQSQESKKSYLSKFEEVTQNLEFIRISHAKKPFGMSLKKKSQSLQNKTIEFEKAVGKTYAVSYGLGNIVYSGTWIIGGIFVFNDMMTLPELIAMTTLMSMIAGPIETMNAYYTEIVSSKKVVNDYLNYLSKNEAVTENKTRHQIGKIHSIRLEKVFYNQGSHPLFQNMDHLFESGKKYAIRGESGVGKSTLLKLLLEVKRTNRGKIVVNDKCLSKIDLNSYYQNIAYVPQHSTVFEGTIAENVSLFLPVNENLIEESIHKAGLKKWLEKKSDVLDEKIGENNLSGGESKRLDIARGLYKDSSVFLMDEPTSGLDETAEIEIGKAIHNLTDKLVIVVTHSTNRQFLKNFDQVLELKEGKLVDKTASY